MHAKIVKFNYDHEHINITYRLGALDDNQLKRLMYIYILSERYYEVVNVTLSEKVAPYIEERYRVRQDE